jgi:hypothetical protein
MYCYCQAHTTRRLSCRSESHLFIRLARILQQLLTHVENSILNCFQTIYYS